MRRPLKIAWVVTLAATALFIFIGLAGQATALYVIRFLDKAEIASYPPGSKFSSVYAENKKLSLKGFAPVVLGSDSPPAPSCKSVVFAGHIYPKNGYDGDPKPPYPDPDNALSAFLEFVDSRKPNRVVFGGDSVWKPSVGELTQLLQLKRRVGDSKFLIGNHDFLVDKHDTATERLHAEIYGRPYEAVTVDDVLLIYLQSIKGDGNWGIPTHQLEFLENIARDSSHKYAVMFFHTVLWDDDNKLRNRNYPNVEQINRTWRDKIAPLLKAGRVKMVVAGDGGYNRPGEAIAQSDINYVVSGWPNFRTDIPVEWLEISLCDSGPRLTRYRLLDGTLYRSVE